MLPIVASAIGVAILAFAVVDVLSTVFGANGRSIASAMIYRMAWTAFRWIGRFMPHPIRQNYLAIGATLMVALLIVVWIGAFIVGFAFLFAGGVVGDVDLVSSGTQTDISSSMRLSLVALSTIGFVEIGPSDKGYSSIVAIEAVTGGFVLTLAASYFIGLQYVIQRRRGFATRLAAWVEAGAEPDISALEDALANLVEGLRSYPVTYFVRPTEFEGSVPWTLMTLAELTAPNGDDPRLATVRTLMATLLEHLDRRPPGRPVRNKAPLGVDSFQALRHGLLPEGDTLAERYLASHDTDVDAETLYDRYRAWAAHVAPVEAVANRVARDLGYEDEWARHAGRLLMPVSNPPRLGADPLRTSGPMISGD